MGNRKRKRSDFSLSSSEEKSKSSSVSTSSRPPPSEKEVEDFFNIIRQIHKIKNSGKTSICNVNGSNGGSSGKSDNAAGKGSNGVIIDLNAVPQDMTDGA